MQTANPTRQPIALGDSVKPHFLARGRVHPAKNANGVIHNSPGQRPGFIPPNTQESAESASHIIPLCPFTKICSPPKTLWQRIALLDFPHPRNNLAVLKLEEKQISPRPMPI